MGQVWTVAINELRAGFRNRMVIAAIAMLGSLALVLVLFGSTPIGDTRAGGVAITYVSLASLSIYLIPLLALLLSFDSIIGEAERGSLLLLMSYPLTRAQLLVGKFCGHLAVLALAVVFGYGAAGLYLYFLGQGSPAEWRAYGEMMASSILLGAVFIAAGSLISNCVRESSTAVGAAIVVWLVVVVLYDLGLLTLMVLDTELRLGSDLIAGLIAVNPADAYRLFNIGGAEASAVVSGTAGLADAGIWSRNALIGVMLAWIAALMAVNLMLFRRKEL